MAVVSPYFSSLLGGATVIVSMGRRGEKTSEELLTSRAGAKRRRKELEVGGTGRKRRMQEQIDLPRRSTSTPPPPSIRYVPWSLRRWKEWEAEVQRYFATPRRSPSTMPPRDLGYFYPGKHHLHGIWLPAASHASAALCTSRPSRSFAAHVLIDLAYVHYDLCEDDDDLGELNLHGGMQMGGELDGSDTQNSHEGLKINVQDIDGYWRPRMITHACAVIDPQQSKKLAEEILKIIAECDDRDVENRLVMELDYEKFDIIKLVLKNRFRIVWCTRLARAEDQQEGKKVQVEMMSNPGVVTILEHLNLHATRASRKERQKNLEKSIRDEEVHVPGLKHRPYATGEKILKISDILGWAQPPFAGMQELNRVQSKVYDTALFKPDNIRDTAISDDTLTRFLEDESASQEVIGSHAELVKSSDLKDLPPNGFAIHEHATAEVEHPQPKVQQTSWSPFSCCRQVPVFLLLLLLILSGGIREVAADTHGAWCDAHDLSIKLWTYCDVTQDSQSKACCDTIFATLGRDGCLCKVAEEPEFRASGMAGASMIVNMYYSCDGGPYVNPQAEQQCDKMGSPPPLPPPPPPPPPPSAAKENPMPSHHWYWKKIVLIVVVVVSVLVVLACGGWTFYRRVRSSWAAQGRGYRLGGREVHGAEYVQNTLKQLLQKGRGWFRLDTTDTAPAPPLFAPSATSTQEEDCVPTERIVEMVVHKRVEAKEDAMEVDGEECPGTPLMRK